MQSDPRIRGRGFPSERESRPLSVGGHHVTEAIGDMYDESDHERQASLGGDEGFDFKGKGPEQNGPGDRSDSGISYFSSRTSSSRPSPLSPGLSNREAIGSPRRDEALSAELSPSLSLNTQSPSFSDGSSAHFALSDIDYESDPAAVAKELSNLQALRRMSMDVSPTADPDLPFFNIVPPTAPKGPDSADDPSRLFWVPARLHPELAPKEFKLFVETRVKEIRRPSSSDGSLSPDLAGPSLRRKKSMLSRQIDNTEGKGAEGYKDGAEILERRKSMRDTGEPELKLEELVKDPSALVRKLSLSSQDSSEVKPMSLEDDRPILPAAPPGHALKRSTRTTYRRGSLKTNRGLGRRGANQADSEDEPPVPKIGGGLKRVQTEPIQPSRPIEQDHLTLSPRAPTGPHISPSASFDDLLSNSASAKPQSEPKDRLDRKDKDKKADKKLEKKAEKRSKSPARPIGGRSVSLKEKAPPVPQIVVQSPQNSFKHPERSSSFDHPPQNPPAKSSQRPPLRRASAKESTSTTQTVNNIVSSPAPTPIPGPSAASRTDSLSIIPTFDIKEDKKEKPRRDSAPSSNKKSGWGSWLRGDSDKEKDKDKEPSKVRKSRSTKDKSHDSARLDLIQKSIEHARAPDGKELDRLNEINQEREREREQLERDERERERMREKKQNHEPALSKKEKDPGLFSSFFGSSKKKSTGDLQAKPKSTGGNSRGVSPEPPQNRRPTTPQYYYTRFPMHIERAIYRLSHIKLANPKRPLQQQVLLSNFMYSYLAKVQMTQPHLVPQSHQQQQIAAAPVVEQPQPQPEHHHQQNMYSDQGAVHDQQQYYQYEDMNQEYADDGQGYEYADGHGGRPNSRAAQYVAEENDYYSDDDHGAYADDDGQGHHHHNQHYQNQHTQQQLQYYHQSAGTGDNRGRGNEEMW